MTYDPVTVDLSMRREHLRELEHKDRFSLCVTATAQAPYVDDIRIDLYLTDHPLRAVSGKALTYYPLTSGETYTSDFTTGDIIAVIVRYTIKEHPGWLVAASGIWMATGHYFMSGGRLLDMI